VRTDTLCIALRNIDRRNTIGHYPGQPHPRLTEVRLGSLDDLGL
jgi:hypothetical protein